MSIRSFFPHQMLLALALAVLMVSCGSEIHEIKGTIPSLPDSDSADSLDVSDAALSKYISQGKEVDPKLTGIYVATLNPALKWHHSLTNKTLDKPPIFDCEGYVRYVYRTYLHREPWRDVLAAEILDVTDGFPEQNKSRAAHFRLIDKSVAERGDLVVWREKDGFPSNHVAIYDGYVNVPQKGKSLPLKVAMVVSTSDSAEAAGIHAIQRFPLRFTMGKTTKKLAKGPYFVQVIN